MKKSDLKLLVIRAGTMGGITSDVLQDGVQQLSQPEKGYYGS